MVTMSMNSSDTCSFEAAMPVEASASEMQGSEGSHPSSGGSYTNMTSIPPSDTTRGSVPAIEDAACGRRAIGRVRRRESSSYRQVSGTISKRHSPCKDSPEVVLLLNSKHSYWQWRISSGTK